MLQSKLNECARRINLFSYFDFDFFFSTILLWVRHRRNQSLQTVADIQMDTASGPNPAYGQM